MATKIGYQAALYYKVGGLGGGGSWVLAANVKDVTSQDSATEVDASTRESSGYMWNEPGLISASVEFDVVFDATDPFYSALSTAYYARAAIGIRVMSGPDVGDKGLQADMKVFSLTRNEPLDDLMMVSVVLKPCRSTTAPSIVTL